MSMLVYCLFPGLGLSASLVKRVALGDLPDTGLVLNIALDNAQSFLSPEDIAKVRFKLDRSVLDAMMSLMRDSEVVASIDTIRATAIYENDKQFMLQFIRYKNRELTSILGTAHSWGAAEYSVATLGDVKNLLITHVSDLASLCLVEYLPGDIIRKYLRYFERVDYPETVEDAPAKSENGATLLTSIRVVDGATIVEPLTANVLRINGREGSTLIDIRKRCAVQVTRAYRYHQFFPSERVISLERAMVSREPGRFQLFWGHRARRGFTNLELSDVGEDVFALSIVPEGDSPSMRVSLFSTQANSLVWERVDIEEFKYEFGGDYLVRTQRPTIDNLANVSEFIPLIAEAKKVLEEPSYSLQWGSGARSPIRYFNFKAGVASISSKTSGDVYIYDIRQLKQKLNRIVAAIDDLWGIEGMQAIVLAQTSGLRRWRVVAQIATRELPGTRNIHDKHWNWAHRALAEFRADKYRYITVAHFQKLLKP